MNFIIFSFSFILIEIRLPINGITDGADLHVCAPPLHGWNIADTAETKNNQSIDQ